MASDGGDEAKAASSSATAAAAAAARSGGGGSDDFDHYNDDHDDDLDFDPSASDDDDDDDEDGDEDEEDNDDNNIDEAASNDPIVLEGTMYLNDSGKIIFSGTWCLHSQQTDAYNSKESEGILNDEKRKQQTFRLESLDAFTAPHNPTSIVSESSGDPSIFDSQGNIKESIKAKLNGPIAFDLRYPTMERLGVLDGVLPQNADIPERRSPILFDGHFIEPTANEKKKVKEGNISIIFSLCEMQFDNPKRYDMEGSGSNEYGTFVINGSYHIPRGEGGVNGNNSQTMAMASVWCTKTYDFNGGNEEKERRRKRGGMKRRKGYDDEDDDDDDDDSYDDNFLEGKTDYAEVGELYQEATMSIEDLRRKYYGGGGAGDDADDDNVDDDDADGGGKLPAVKKPRPAPTEDDSDDDDCGF